jgi:hypothetical protein
VECFSSVRIVGEDHLCAIVANLAVEGSCRGRLGEAGACEGKLSPFFYYHIFHIMIVS